ncbi:protein translocase subunit SecF [Pantoea sp. Mhis]|uniref:protein translocase subunit SecF n=1 Tax=Pantoea sp. Mhis TaxID=2576759 RepID=UPI00135C3D35|nr:protein translocase subunit SecF [Pantoea sp. Mhis]MXP56232.1 protein translocase subunit SecF [Pantoea sp. Mhis]
MKQYNDIKQLKYGCKIIDFMRCDKLAFIISIFLILFSIIIIAIRGFNWGLDFTGGVLIEITLEKPIGVDILRQNLLKANFHDPVVQNLDDKHDIIVRIASFHREIDQETGNKVVSTINKILHQNVIVKRIESIGSSVSSDLAQSSIIALLSALIAILIYITLRFEWCVALGIVLALIHDVIINCGILSFLHVEIDLTIIASLMSVMSYSLNDKIVVFDRIRENFRKTNNISSYNITNISLTQTLNRTLITSIITFLIILILFVFGGILLKNFSLTMLIGVTIGTISSIYISCAIALRLGMKREHLLLQTIEKDETNEF